MRSYQGRHRYDSPNRTAAPRSAWARGVEEPGKAER